MIPWRDENPTRKFPGITLTLIAANAAIFVWSRFFSNHFDRIIKLWGFVSVDWRTGMAHALAVPQDALTPVTSLFLHGGVLHALGNLWFLGIFGDNVEDEQGHGRFLFFYLICGLFAVYGHYLYAPDSALPLVGASGAISGVLAAYVFYHPTAMVRSFVPVIVILVPVRIPAFLFIGIWALMQVAGGMYGGEGTSVAYAAHVAGFIAGLGLAPFFRQKVRRRKR